MQQTEQQAAFNDALINTNDNLALVARAGCGKTTTILMGVDALAERMPEAEITVCAFNKAIADEVGEKLKKRGHGEWRQINGRNIPPRVQASTLHSMGFSLLKFMFKCDVDAKKVFNLIDERNEDIYKEYGTQIAQLVGFAKGAGVGFFNDLPINDHMVWYQIADHYDVNGLDDTSQMEQVVDAAINIYRASLAKTDVVDFDDMILFPLIKNIRVKFTKDFVFLDEAQDLSRARQALARKFIKYGTGRMIVVGDDRQAIYGFSGADANALRNLVESLNARTLPLSITWRCPKKVVELAQTIVPDIEAAESAEDGEVLRVGEMPKDLNTEDAILCRNTAPLITLAYKLIRSGVPCKVEGRSIGEGLIKLANRWKVDSIDGLLNRLDSYKEREIQKAMARNNEAKAEEVTDRVDTVVEICNACIEQDKHMVADVCQFIRTLFADGADNVVTLATYHRSKGREWPRVILFEHAARCPSRAARKPWQIEQEENLAYVAYTRAQKQLVFVG